MTRDELKDFFYLRFEIEQLEERISELEERKGSIKAKVIDGPPGATGNGSSTVESSVLNLIQITENYQAKVKDYTIKEIAVENAIDTIRRPLSRQIMRYRYLDGYSWEAIGNRLNYSVSYLLKLHSEALDIICDHE